MKTYKLVLGIVVLFLAGTLALSAQPGPGQGPGKGKGCTMGMDCKGIPNLTEDQQKKIGDLRVAHQKEMMAFHNQMGELKAKQKTLTTADKPDMKAINANIDEITKLQNQMMKKAAEHRQQVRNLLTDEQKLWFDSHVGGGKGKMGRHMRNCGDCPYQQKHNGPGPKAKM